MRQYYIAHYDELRQKLETPEYWRFFKKYREDIFAHGADRDFADELEMIELDAEITWHRNAMDRLGWDK